MNELMEARDKLDSALSRLERFITSCKHQAAETPSEVVSHPTASSEESGDVDMLNSECARLTALLDAERERNSKLQQVADELDTQFAAMLQEFDQLLEA